MRAAAAILQFYSTSVCSSRAATNVVEGTDELHKVSPVGVAQIRDVTAAP